MGDLKIGPITITNKAHQYDGNEHPGSIDLVSESFKGLEVVSLGSITTGEESFQFTCSQKEALQIRGVMKQQLPVWIDTSPDLTVNENFRHRGWYVLLAAEPDFDLGPNLVTLRCSAKKISPNQYEFLEMDYTPGTNDGTEIYREFTETTPLQIFTDTFSSFDTTNTWMAANSWNMLSSSIAASGGSLVFQGYRSSTSYEAVNWTYQRATYNPPFTMEGHIECTATPPANQHQELWLTLMRSPPTSYGFPDPCFINYGVVQRSYGKFVHLRGMVPGRWIYNKYQQIYTTTPGLKIKYYADGQMETWLDTGAGYNQFTSKFDMGIGSVFRPCYNALWFATFSSPTVYSMKLNDYSLYSDMNIGGNNIIHLPATATPVVPVTPTFTRTTAEGAVNCYTNPGDDLTFQIDPAHLYDGSVKAYNTNYTGAATNLMTNTDEEILSNTWWVSNGLVNIYYSSGLVFQGYYNSQWNTIKTFTFPSAPNLFRPVFISPDRVTIQIDKTYWTVERGKQFIRVEHPYTDLGFTKGTCYYADGATTTDPADGATITMSTQFYCNIWNRGSGTCITPNPAQDYRLQIIKTIPGSIKSNSIPASSDTGIGWYNTNITSTDPNGYLYNAREFNIQPECVLKIRRP